MPTAATPNQVRTVKTICSAMTHLFLFALIAYRSHVGSLSPVLKSKRKGSLPTVSS